MLRPYGNGHHAQVLMNTAVIFLINSGTKSKANTNQIMYSAVRCRLPECGGFVLQRKDEGFTFFVIINDLNYNHHYHHQNHHVDSRQVLTVAGNVGFANRSNATRRCLHLPPCSRTRCTSAPCAPLCRCRSAPCASLCRCTHNPANLVLSGA